MRTEPERNPERVRLKMMEVFGQYRMLEVPDNDAEVYISLAAHEKALAEARRETWDAAIEILVFKLRGEQDHRKEELRRQIIEALEAAAKGERK